jgi:acyl carrier protein
MRSNQEVGTAVEEIISDRLRIDQSAFDDETAFTDEAIDADSLDIVETAEAIDANLGVHIPDEELEGMETVGDLKQYVREQH